MGLVRVVAVLSLFGLATSSRAQGLSHAAGDAIADPPWLREEMDRVRAANRMPALAAAADGKVAAASAVGFRRAGSHPRGARTDALHLSSVARPLSATMFGRLVDEGLLRWDMTMAEMFPELAGAMQAGYKTVTVAQLLSQSGGFPYQPRTPEEVDPAPDGVDRDLTGGIDAGFVRGREVRRGEWEVARSVGPAGRSRRPPRPPDGRRSARRDERRSRRAGGAR